MSAVAEPRAQTRTAEPADFPDSPLAQALRQPLMLGLFLPVYDGGWSPSASARTTTWDYSYNQALAQHAESLGFDLLFGPAEWVPAGGYGGEIRFRENSIDPFISTAALSAVTHKIILISTLHVLYAWHPLNLARFGATLDHISGGRWGINVVTGHSAREARMFGIQRAEHTQRYRMAAEFIEIMNALWRREGAYTHAGQFWQLEDAFVSPAPRYGRPILVNATGSPAGAALAGAYADIVFITSPVGADIECALSVLPAHNEAIKGPGRERGRAVKTLINPMVVCRDTEQEAREYHDYILRGCDRNALVNYYNHLSSGDTKSLSGHDLERRILGGNVQLIGSVDQVVDYIRRLSRAGCDGIQLSFFDFKPDLEFFGRKVLPELQRLGLRH